MNTSMQSRTNRMTTGAVGQAELKALLEQRGFFVVETGQETWLPESAHAVLRLVHHDLTVRALRYMPDFFAWAPRFPYAFWDAKVNATPNTPNFTIEDACFQEQMARHLKGERVVIAFRDTDGAWRANWVDKLHVSKSIEDRRHEARGSMTAYRLVGKLSAVPLSAFIANP